MLNSRKRKRTERDIEISEAEEEAAILQSYQHTDKIEVNYSPPNKGMCRIVITSKLDPHLFYITEAKYNLVIEGNKNDPITNLIELLSGDLNYLSALAKKYPDFGKTFYEHQKQTDTILAATDKGAKRLKKGMYAEDSKTVKELKDKAEKADPQFILNVKTRQLVPVPINTNRPATVKALVQKATKEEDYYDSSQQSQESTPLPTTPLLPEDTEMLDVADSKASSSSRSMSRSSSFASRRLSSSANAGKTEGKKTSHPLTSSSSNFFSSGSTEQNASSPAANTRQSSKLQQAAQQKRASS